MFFFYDVRVNRNYALSTLPERRHEVQTYIFFVPPFTFTLTDFKFDFQILLLLLWEWLTALPKCTPFPHTAHLAMKSTSFCLNFACLFYMKQNISHTRQHEYFSKIPTIMQAKFLFFYKFFYNFFHKTSWRNQISLLL